jgi:hypothetical protein
VFEIKFIKYLPLVVLLCLQCKAQDAPRKSVFSVKPAAGLSGCQIHGDSYSGYDKLGLLFGTAVNARLKKKSSLELGFYFSQKGSRKNQNPKNNDYRFYRVNLNYLDLPLSFRYKINEKYFVTLGPSAAYLVSYREETELGDWTGSYPFNKFEVGLNFGIGGRIRDHFTIELRSSNSVIPIRDYGILANQVFYPNPVARFFNRGLYNNLLTLFVAYEFRFDDKDND